jgi:hypothetical protein
MMQFKLRCVVQWLVFSLFMILFSGASTALAQSPERFSDRLSCDYCFDLDGGEEGTSSRVMHQSSGGGLALRLSAELGFGLVGAVIGVGLFYAAVGLNHLADRVWRENSALGLILVLGVIVVGAMAIVMTPTAVASGGHRFGGQGDLNVTLLGSMILGLPGLLMVWQAFAERGTIEDKALAFVVMGAGQIVGAMIGYEISHRTGWSLARPEESPAAAPQVSLFQYRWAF